MTIPAKPTLLGWGHVGIVYQISSQIVVKRRALNDDEGAFSHENRIFDLLERNPQCPSLVRSFFRTPSANFLQFVGDSLEIRLQRYQMRDPKTSQVLQVWYREPLNLVTRWIIELVDAVAILESLELVHADIRPPNILLDSRDRLKVIDFDSTTIQGAPIQGAQPPYARVLGVEGGQDRGSFGDYGPRTEQFALGGIFYYMTRGYEPYDNEWFGHDHGPKIVELLQEMKFPETGDDEIDTIIRKCWHGEYASIQALKLDVIRLTSNNDAGITSIMEKEEYEARRQECEQLVKEGILDVVPRAI